MTGSGANAAAMVAMPSARRLDIEADRIGIAGDLAFHRIARVCVQRVEFQQRLGVHADHAVDDELQPRQADAGVRNLREIESAIGVADVHHDFQRRLAACRRARRIWISKSSSPS